jgi:hypothetical protein
MTVKELIEELSNYDDDQIVTVSNSIDGKLHLVTGVDIDYVAYISEEDDVVVLYS